MDSLLYPYAWYYSRMNLRDLQEQWNDFGVIDPLWAILTWPEKRHGKWNIEEFFEYGKKEVNEVFTHIQSLGLLAPSGVALDFGCGVGRLTQALCQRFTEVHGVDIAPSMIALANTYNSYPEKCQYHLNEVSNLDLFPDNKFDFIYTRLTLQHMEPVFAKQYMQEFIRLLKPGGLLIFQQPSRLRPEWQLFRQQFDKGIKGFIKRLVPPNALNRYRRLRAKFIHQPTMELYGIEKADVEALLITSGASLLDVSEFGDAGPEWVSYRYSVTK
jgi:ubiquinone/menaquinone biosynthesis C-methylase UbiE